jgi:Uma2 family endonuclease
MAVMTSVEPEQQPFGREFTVHDLETMPDDGHRYELLDGTLLVSPAPGWAHQDATVRLWRLLEDARPAEARVLVAPFAVQFSEKVEFQPDVLVARYDDLTPKNLPTAPLLAVEVRSPSTALIDMNLKKAAYARHRVASYWIVDPSPDQPSVTVFELDGAEYVEVARAVGDAELAVDRPFPVRLRPADLLAGLRRG